MATRRDFLKGLGALLVTTAIVKPVVPEVFFGIDTAAGADASVYWMSDDCLLQIVSPNVWRSLMAPAPEKSILQGQVGEYLGFMFVERE